MQTVHTFGVDYKQWAEEGKNFVDLWEKADTSQPEIRGSNAGKFLGLSDRFFRLLMENNPKRMNQKLEKLLLRPYRLLGEDDRIT